MRTKNWKTVAAVLPLAVVVWYVTAPASMALQRIASGGNGGTFARLVCAATDAKGLRIHEALRTANCSLPCRSSSGSSACSCASHLFLWL
jgi:hypothetical protein